MTQNTLSDEIERVVEELDKIHDGMSDWTDLEYRANFLSEARLLLEQSLTSIAEKTVEAVRVEEADHAKKGINPGHSKDEMYCCIECELDTEYNAAVTEQSKKAKEWLGEDV